MDHQMLAGRAKLRYSNIQGWLREVNMSTASKVGVQPGLRLVDSYDSYTVHRVKPDSIDEYKAAAWVF